MLSELYAFVNTDGMANESVKNVVGQIRLLEGMKGKEWGKGSGGKKKNPYLNTSTSSGSGGKKKKKVSSLTSTLQNPSQNKIKS